MSDKNLIQQFVHFLKTEKFYWIVPLVIVLILLAILGYMEFFGDDGEGAPFLYPNE